MNEGSWVRGTIESKGVYLSLIPRYSTHGGKECLCNLSSPIRLRHLLMYQAVRAFLLMLIIFRNGHPVATSALFVLMDVSWISCPCLALCSNRAKHRAHVSYQKMSSEKLPPCHSTTQFTQIMIQTTFCVAKQLCAVNSSCFMQAFTRQAQSQLEAGYNNGANQMVIEMSHKPFYITYL